MNPFPRRIVGQPEALAQLVADCVAKVAPDERIVAALFAVLTISGHGASRRFRWRFQVVQQPGLVASRAFILNDAARGLRTAALNEADS